MKGPVVVLYDIADEERRALVRTALRPFADRFQQSGWYIPPVAGFTATRVTAGLSSLILPSDRVAAYQPCPRCAQDMRWLPTDAWRPSDTPAGIFMSHR
ncbi:MULTISPECIES: CRISPR-associated endonuclease Cas2 [Protofrankia]|uniref:Uncharacterized protein n=1 Tax=Protofrankia coriariae TaxID=1562887 RepID=A0ABR5F248_9ACTN|nr:MULTISPECIES: CRISPR-associated endonuclease Cas2 [Protofrankia]KLL10793.1 hypothetical protein FrCorBMG51_15315 [Protofrankia coriariae]ONH33994.1 hypothetical protein BL254_18280 [Protofrankia sp. BMG5.30]